MTGKDMAFPHTLPQECRDGQLVAHGLTKRELFAAMAMQGILANPDATRVVLRTPGKPNEHDREADVVSGSRRLFIDWRTRYPKHS